MKVVNKKMLKYFETTLDYIRSIVILLIKWKGDDFLQEKILYKKVIKSIVNALKEHMKNLNIEFSEDKDDCKVILEYLNFKEKIIIPFPRTVIFSRDLKKKIDNSIFTPKTEELIYYFKDLFEKGSNVNNHLSKSIFSGIQQDILFNNWNIKHIHLNEREANSKEEMGENRGDFLLFCIIIEKYVFFLDVREHPHGAGFTSYSFLEIIFNNDWMQYIGFNELNDIIDIAFKVTDDSDIYKLYNAHVNIIFKLGNKFFINVNGVRSSGDKGKNVDRASEIVRYIKENCDNFSDNTEYKVTFFKEENLFSVQLNNQCFSFQI